MLLLGKWTRDSLEDTLRKSSSYRTPGERIYYISSLFLGTAYEESTMLGDAATPEVFVINLQKVDCFTFIEYIEAMRLSGSFHEFEKNLEKIRYRSGKVAFTARKHFFTDWIEFNKDFVDDVTKQIGEREAMPVRKQLNLREDGTSFLCGIQPFSRDIEYIPSSDLAGKLVDSLETGDYIGIYSDTPGLDVSHVGIFVKTGGKAYLRHASSSKERRKVVDQDFDNYIKTKPGIIVLRPKKMSQDNG